jgi:hypothetical protein
MTPVPLNPLLSNVSSGWGKAQTIMKWFSKLVTNAYGWSDGLIKFRQKKANNAYKIKQAEKEALRIMEEQKKKRESEKKNLGKRDWSEEQDMEDLQEFLEMLKHIE